MIDFYLNETESELKKLFSEKKALYPDKLFSAMEYSVFSAGKRVRPYLMLLSAEFCGVDCKKIMPLAVSLELIHTYSLIHDDLPCMDNDDLRRGRPSCHKAFGEATALLAGDLLLTEAFEAIASAPADPEVNVCAARALSLGAGSRGMIYGQELDLKYEAIQATEAQLRTIHRNKTGALINAAVQLGAAAAKAGEEERRALEQYAYGLGLVFQIVDDVLDVTSTEEQLGKPIGSDSSNSKTTFATLYGAEKAMELAREMNNQACCALREKFGDKADFLLQLADALLVRCS